MPAATSWSHIKRTHRSSIDPDEYRPIKYAETIDQIEKRLRALKLPRSVIERHISALRKSRAVPRKRLVKFGSIYRSMSPKQIERLRRERNPPPIEWAATRV
jgi:DNA-binding transcriptional ArsR family regulator